MPGNVSNQNFDNEYLKSIKDFVFTRADSTENGGNGDGKMNISEALNDLHIGSLLSGLNPSSNEYKELKSLTDKIPNALNKYAGSDGIFQAEEWANFLNGNEWGAVLDKFHSSSNYAKMEMGWVDNNKHAYQDGKTTKGEVKVQIIQNFAKHYPTEDNTIVSKIESIIDKYSGIDGTFTVNEYTQMLNDPTYKAFLKKYPAARPGTGI